MDTVGSVEKTRPKRVRVSRACQACRKRKISCSGSPPCTKCQADDITCDFNNVDGRRVKSKRSRLNDIDDSTTGSPVTSQGHVVEPSSPYVEDDQQHTGPTSGFAFLQQAVLSTSSIEADHQSHRARSVLGNRQTARHNSNSIVSSGDLPSSRIDLASSVVQLPSHEESDRLLLRYFEYATPTYRFLHKPTTEEWARRLIRFCSSDPQGEEISAAQEAIILMVWAQALAYGSSLNENGVEKRNFYYEKAKSLIDSERGQPKIESCQARLAMCLYLASTFRLDQCWYRFGMTALIIQALGFHIKTPSTISMPSSHCQPTLLESECRKRVFWSAYILDRYLSVIKGRPRIFRDEDINQEYPANVRDEDLISTDRIMLSMLPPYGMLEAQICHAKLVHLMGKTTDLLFSLNPPDKEELLSRAESLTGELREWENKLPPFLKPAPNVLVGEKIFERQNTVIKLSYAHVRILVTRQFLLEDFTKLGQGSSPEDTLSQKFVDDCIDATLVIIDAIEALINSNSLINGFWFFQCIALCAITTFYIYIIHRNLESSALVSKPQNGKPYMDIVDHCQRYLVSLAPEHSSNHRYHALLAKLRRSAHEIAYRNSGHSSAIRDYGNTGSVVQRIHTSAASMLPPSSSEEESRHTSRGSDTSMLPNPQANQGRIPFVNRDGRAIGTTNHSSPSRIVNHTPTAATNRTGREYADYNEIPHYDPSTNIATAEINFDDFNMTWGYLDQLGSYFRPTAFFGVRRVKPKVLRIYFRVFSDKSLIIGTFFDN